MTVDGCLSSYADMVHTHSLVVALAAVLNFSLVHALDPFIFGSFVGNSATYSVASELGFFTEQGLNVTLSPVGFVNHSAFR